MTKAIRKPSLRNVIRRAAKVGIVPVRSEATETGLRVEWSNGAVSSYDRSAWVLPR